MPASARSTTPTSMFAQVNTEQAEKDAVKKKSSVLTVVVVGKGRRIPQAEVKIRFAHGEERLATNNAGEANFTSPATGTAEVRVIVTGWESVLKEVALKEEPVRLTIDLKSLADAK